MGKLVLFMHTTVDGFVAGPNGKMDWIKLTKKFLITRVAEQMKLTLLYMGV